MVPLKEALHKITMANHETGFCNVWEDGSEDLEVADVTLIMAVQQSKSQATQVPSSSIAQQLTIPLIQPSFTPAQVSPTLQLPSTAPVLASGDHNGPPLSPNASQSVTSSSAGLRRLHVTNLPFKVKDDQLRNLFEEHGAVADAEIIYNERGSKGFGFVTMATVEGAMKAKDALHGKEIQGRRIEVNNATPRTMPVKGTKRTALSSSPGQSASRSRTYGPSYTGNWNAAAYLASLAEMGSSTTSSSTAPTAMTIAVPAPPSPISFPLDPQHAHSFAAGFAAAQLSQQISQQESYAAYYNYALSQASQQQHLAYRGNFPNLASSHRYQPY